METQSSANQSVKFQEGDRVRRSGGEGGPAGTIAKVRIERSRATIKEGTGEPPGITITVLWDNGTLSHFVPDSLTKI